jgi:hypothetical protein
MKVDSGIDCKLPDNTLSHEIARISALERPQRRGFRQNHGIETPMEKLQKIFAKLWGLEVKRKV